jgi:hypothetical protein
MKKTGYSAACGVVNNFSKILYIWPSLPRRAKRGEGGINARDPQGIGTPVVGLNLLSQYLEAFVLPAITRGREFSSFSPESCVVLSKNAFLEGLFGSCPPLSGFFFPVVLVGRKQKSGRVLGAWPSL